MNLNLRRVFTSTTLWCSVLLLGSQVAFAQNEGEGDANSAMSQADEMFEQLEEVVVIGYGTQKKKDLTGSSASVSAEDFNGGVVTSPEMLIQGKAAGITITPTNGEPGGGVSVRVRGGTSISSSNEPLYVIDGMPIQSANTLPGGTGLTGGSQRNPLSRLNPNDIESITVLKDASATAIYGARGANGVVLITTKKGKGGSAMAVDYNYQLSASTLAKKLDLLTADEYRAAVNRFGLGNTLGNADTDWQDEVFQTGVAQQHNLSLSGGSAEGNYRLSLGYLDQDGIVINSGTERFTSRLSMNQKTLDGKLTLSGNINVSQQDDNLTPYQQTGGFEGGIFTNVMKMNPTLPVYDADGNYTFVSNSVRNPVQAALEIDDVARTTGITMNGTARLDLGDLVEGLSATANTGYDTYNTLRKTYLPKSTPYGVADNGIAAQKFGQVSSQVLETYLNYDAEVGGNMLNLIGGYSWQENNYEGFGATAYDFVTDNYSFNNLDGGGRAQLGDKYSYRGASRLVSFYTRANYDIGGKLMLTGTVRRDGSSKFGANNKWGVFPSFAAALRLSEFDFVPESFSDLKLRAGWGVVGNEAIGEYQSIARIGTGSNAVIGGSPTSGTGYLNPANPSLRWESTASTNVGLDWELNDGKFYGSLDVFQKNTSDLLLTVPAPAPSVAPTLLANVGATSNTGFDLMLNYALVSTSDFGWDIGFNLSRSRLMIEDLGTNSDILTGAISGAGQSGAFAQKLVVGEAYGTFYGLVYDASANTYSDEAQVIGLAQPDFTYGFLNTFRFGKFNASVFFRGQQGGSVFNNTAMEYTTLDNLNTNINLLAPALDFTDDMLTSTPTYSSQWIEDASFLRLDNLNISYDVDVKGSQWLNSAVVGLSGQNLLLLTNYSGYDPEVNTAASGNGAPSLGVDYTNYPRARTIALNVKFNLK
ncbi:SusC/RagA family TonB-linked outer membrane protein [Schleiferiaceae bacterium]|jgi:iron complex outermembrane receptor protein|nr:SusC/RagA family TonB-linked outer membrane protein [Schleiferiaceae bacterium]